MEKYLFVHNNSYYVGISIMNLFDRFTYFSGLLKNDINLVCYIIKCILSFIISVIAYWWNKLKNSRFKFYANKLAEESCFHKLSKMLDPVICTCFEALSKMFISWTKYFNRQIFLFIPLFPFAALTIFFVALKKYCIYKNKLGFDWIAELSKKFYRYKKY